MRRAALLLLPILLAPLPGRALESTGGFGAWGLVEGRNSDGAATCAMESGTRDGRTLLFLWTDQDPVLFLRLVDPAWRLRTRQEVDVVLRFDDGRGFRGAATASGRSQIEIPLRREAIPNFLDSWRRSHEIHISFPGAGERSWRFSLAGSSRTTDLFAGCLRRARDGASRLRGGAADEHAEPDGAPRAGEEAPGEGRRWREGPGRF